MNSILHSSKAARSAIALAVATLAFTTGSQAGLQIPYTPDDNTLHLWHLNDPDGLTAVDAVANSPITLTNVGLPNPSVGPYTNVHLGVPSFVGQGTCLKATTKPHLLYGGPFSDVSQFCNPVSGAFTFEAIIKFDATFGAIDVEIVSGDNASGLAARGWQWRIFNGVMEWNLLAGNSTDNGFKSTLPLTGINAALSNTWYHVAVTFTGNSPTNSDTANLLTFYWTLLDANRTAADPLGQFTMTRPLNGSPAGASAPGLGVAGSARNLVSNPGNNEGLVGSIDEVRISNVALKSNQMAFIVGGAINPPSFTQQPPPNTVSGYGKTLTVPALATGSPTLLYQWQQTGTNVLGQTNTTLIIANATFANGGDYQLIVTNNYGSATSVVAHVTIGAAPTDLFNTGLDTNGVLSAGDIPDPHWTLSRSADVNYLGPNAPIFEYSFPIQFADPNGSFSPTNGFSMWIGAIGNQGGVAPGSLAGQYVYRSTFLLDTADPSSVTLGGNLWTSGSISDILVNGKSTGIALAPGGTLYVTTFSITNGFVPGQNTLDFVENLAGAAISAIRVEISGVGLALPAGLPVITKQPADQMVRDGTVTPDSLASFSVVALGRPPLTYQWLANGAALSGATNRTLSFINPTSGAQGTNFQVIVRNDSGSVTSRLASLTMVPTNQPPVGKTFRFVAFPGQALTLPLSEIVQGSTDPDHDPISFSSADIYSTNAVQYATNNVIQTGAALTYYPVENYVGADQFSYTISDQAVSSIGFVNTLVLLQPAGQVVAPGGSATFSVGITNPPPGYSFQWQLNGANLSTATTGVLTVTNAQVADAGGYRLVITDSSGQPSSSGIAGLTVGTLGTGTGLTGDYYNLANGTGNFVGLPTLTRVDPTLDMNFGTGSPDPSIAADLFQVRWHGQVQPLYSDLYTFSTTTDDGARLWVNNQLLVNRWVNQAATAASGTIQLAANQKYDIVMEYYENTSVASVLLSWSSTHQAPQAIPMTQLYPDASLVRPRLSTTLNNGTNLVLNWSGTFNLESATVVTGPWSAVANSIIGPYSVPVVGSKYFRLVDPISP